MKAFIAIAALAILAAGFAPAQAASEPKLEISGMSFFAPDDHGFFNASVSLGGITCDGRSINYSLTVQHVKLPSEVEERLRPQIEDIKKDLRRDCK